LASGTTSIKSSTKKGIFEKEPLESNSGINSYRARNLTFNGVTIRTLLPLDVIACTRISLLVTQYGKK